MTFINKIPYLIALLVLALSCKDKEVEDIPPAISVYFPEWADMVPVTTIVQSYNADQTAAENGTALVTAMMALEPGQCLKIGARIL